MDRPNAHNYQGNSYGGWSFKFWSAYYSFGLDRWAPRYMIGNDAQTKEERILQR